MGILSNSVSHVAAGLVRRSTGLEYGIGAEGPVDSQRVGQFGVAQGDLTS